MLGYQNPIITRTVDTHIRRLRGKLGSHAQRLETVRAEGYRFNPVLDLCPRCGRGESASLMQWWLIARTGQLNFSSLAMALRSLSVFFFRNVRVAAFHPIGGVNCLAASSVKADGRR
jgi:hypothetical protein